MARRRHVPKLQHHKASGQARVTVAGRDRHIGPWGSAQAARAYARILAEDEGRAVRKKRGEPGDPPRKGLSRSACATDSAARRSRPGRP